MPVLAGAATIWLAGAMARAMGGGAFAALVAAAAVLISGTHAALASIYTLNALDVLWWALGQLLLIRLVNRERPVLWATLGIVVGLGLLTKLSMLWFGLGLGVAIIATPERRWLTQSGPWLAALIALMLGTPYILWQIAHDWVTWDWMMHGSNAALRDASVATFLVNQIVVINPVNAPLWIGGLVTGSGARGTTISRRSSPWDFPPNRCTPCGKKSRWWRRFTACVVNPGASRSRSLWRIGRASPCLDSGTLYATNRRVGDPEALALLALRAHGAAALVARHGLSCAAVAAADVRFCDGGDGGANWGRLPSKGAPWLMDTETFRSRQAVIKRPSRPKTYD